MQPPFIWDPYSDQPYPIKEKAYKKKMRKKHLLAYVPLLLTSAVFFPLAILLMPFLKGKQREKSDFFGMGVSLEQGEGQQALIEELGVKHLLVRMPLWKIDRIDKYVNFAKSFGEDKVILVNILQDREHIEDIALLKKDIQTVFEKFGTFVSEFQVGNAVNRTKWGFFSMEEYLQWYAQVQQIRDTYYPHLKLVGSSVIDFEYHYTIRTLFHNYPLKYDRFSALLYVDRRGAPENTQMGIFNTKWKISMLYALVKLSSKSSTEIYITEVNWPLLDTAPYAPTSEAECVSEADYADYMESYHQIAYKSGKISRIYWHQLIAPGYGLADNRNGKIRKMPAFEIYKRMVKYGDI